jgi:polyisoprenoid-binding protein YceI
MSRRRTSSAVPDAGRKPQAKLAVQPPARKRSRRRMLVVLAGAALVLVVGVIAVVYFVVFPTSSPPRFKLATTPVAQAGKPTATSPGSSGKLAGSWTIAPGSAAGYRVREKLAFLPAQSDAVGRTSSITGSATLRGPNKALVVSAASFEVDLRTLKSDRGLRDEKLHSVGIESDTYPTAKFVLHNPIDLPRTAPAGSAFHANATGALSLHGVTRQETIPLSMRLSGTQLEAVGSITFPWSDFEMTAPSIAGFVNVTEHATMEFDLRLARS